MVSSPHFIGCSSEGEGASYDGVNHGPCGPNYSMLNYCYLEWVILSNSFPNQNQARQTSVVICPTHHIPQFT